MEGVSGGAIRSRRREEFEVVRFCSGMGSRWARREAPAKVEGSAATTNWGRGGQGSIVPGSRERLRLREGQYRNKCGMGTPNSFFITGQKTVLFVYELEQKTGKQYWNFL